jgi:hypothetical protein
MGIEHRVDRLARRLAGEEPGIFLASSTPGGARRGGATTPESAFDGLARALVTPLSRRRMIAAAGGAVAAASLLRPGQARADCFPGGPKVCSNPKGAKVCVPDDLQCCSNEFCAIACPYPWRDCAGPATCNDSSRMCTVYAVRAGFDKAQTKFCSQQVTVTNGCVPAGQSVATRGWCCKPTEGCGTTFGECVCLSPCGDDCCKKDEECVPLGLFRGSSCLPKCRKGWHHDGADCVCDKGQTCGVVCCPAGKECSGSTCVSPPPPTKWPDLFGAFSNFGDTVNQTAASRGGGSGHARDARIAAATMPVGAALFALGAVNAQAAAAGSSFGDVGVDNAYRRKVSVARPSVPRLVSGTGLDPRAASALQSLMNAEAQAFALVLAAGVALARARGALRHHDEAAARRQVLAAAGFADKAARGLRRMPSLRASAAATLTSTGAAEVTVSAGDVAVLQAAVRSGGVPAELKAALARLGVGGRDLARVKDALLGDSVGGPVLIAPLADRARTKNIQAMATELAAFARKARHRPIVRSHGQAKRYRQR